MPIILFGCLKFMLMEIKKLNFCISRRFFKFSPIDLCRFCFDLT